MNTVKWDDAVAFPSQHGVSTPLGVAGAFAGFLSERLIVAGGSNFPRGSSINGGQKEFCDDLFVFHSSQPGKLTLASHKIMPAKISNGLTVSTPEGLFFVGGENLADDCAEIYYVTLTDNMAKIEKVGQLPFTWSGGVGALHKGKLSLFGGRVDGIPSNQCFMCDLDGTHVQNLAPIPSSARFQMVHALCGGVFYLFHGFSGLLAEPDSYAYHFESDSWKSLPTLKIEGVPFTFSGGAAVAISDEEIALFGGVNKQVFEQASSQMSHLKDQAFQAFKEKYLNQAPAEFRYNNQLFIYNTRTQSFRELGRAPFSGLAGSFPMLCHNQMLWCVCGETKPEVRMPIIKVGTMF